MRSLLSVLLTAALAGAGPWRAGPLPATGPNAHAPDLPEHALREPVQPARAALPLERVRALVAGHCADCHAGERAPAGVDLRAWSGRADWGSGDALDTRVARAVRDVLEEATMPPGERPAPPSELRAGALSELEAALERVRAEAARQAPTSRPPRAARRLNAHELERALRDLLGVDVEAAAQLPSESADHGFDNQVEGLPLSEAWLERWIALAARAAQAALRGSGPAQAPSGGVDTADATLPEGAQRQGARLALFRAGELHFDWNADGAGSYAWTIVAGADRAGGEAARLELRLDGERVAAAAVEASRAEPRELRFEARAAAGPHRVALAFPNDYYDAAAPDPALRDRNVYVDSIAWSGPLDPRAPTAFQERFLAAPPDAATLADLATLVWRGGARDGDAARLLALTTDQDPWPERLRIALAAALASPRFVFAGAQAARGADAWAERMALYLWSSVPDAELMAAARSAEAAPDGASRSRRLDELARAMLRDPRSSALSERFAVQWLEVERLAEQHPDPQRFPEFDAALRGSMLAQAIALFDAVLREGRAARDLIDGDFTFVDGRLAELYGIPAVRGEHLQRVPLRAGLRAERAGVLGLAAVLTATSTATRTSPTKRGKWVLDVLLGAPPAPPPPGAGVIDESPAAVRAGSLRARLEAHRQREDCAGCHARMDALGLALEGFDPLGRRRERADGFDVDDRVELASGDVLEGVAGLRAELGRTVRFERALAFKLATYALWRPLLDREELELDAFVRAAHARGQSLALADLVLAAGRLAGEDGTWSAPSSAGPGAPDDRGSEARR